MSKIITKSDFSQAWDSLGFKVRAWKKDLYEHTETGSKADTYFQFFLEKKVTKDELDVIMDYQVSRYEDEVNRKVEFIIFPTPGMFFNIIVEERKKNFREKKGYCPCCEGTGKITVSEEQNKDRFSTMQIEQPDKFGRLLNKGRIKFKDGEIVGRTAVIACGCRKVDISNDLDRKAGKVIILPFFSDYFPGDDAKCMAASECNPFLRDGKCVCPKDYDHYKTVQEHKNNLVKEDPHYLRFIERKGKLISSRNVKGFSKVGAGINVKQTIKNGFTDNRDTSKNYQQN